MTSLRATTAEATTASAARFSSAVGTRNLAMAAGRAARTIVGCNGAGGKTRGLDFDRHRIADSDRPGLDHLGIDAAVGMAVGLHQRARDFEVADAGVGVHLG